MTSSAKDRPLVAALLAVCALLVIAAPATAARTLYVPNFSDDTLTVYAVGSDGSLARVGLPVAVGDTPEAAVLTPDGRHLFLTMATGIRRFAVDPADGSLTVLGPDTPVADAAGAAVTPDGSRLFVAADDLVEAFAIGADGSLTSLGDRTLGGLEGRAIAITPDARTLYLTGLAADPGDPDSLLTAPIGPGGAPGAVTVVDVQSRDLAKLTITADARFLYVAGSGLNDPSARGIFGYAIGAGGALTELPGNPHPTGGFTFALAASPIAPVLFASAGNTAQAYAVGQTGALTPIGAAAPTGSGPFAAVPAPSGRSVFVTNAFSEDISRFAVAASGALTALGDATDNDVNPGSLFPVISPDQGPAASFAAAPAAAGAPTTFDASGSSDPDGSVARYDWDFGDGTVAPDAGPSPSHVYAQPGDHAVSLTVTDDEGCSTRVVSTGQSAACNGSAAATRKATVTVPAPAPAPVGPGPGPPTPGPAAPSSPSAPQPSRCASKRRFVARHLARRGERVARAVLLDGRRRVRVLDHTRRAVTVDLRGLPRKTFRLRVTLRKGAGKRTVTRTYRPCRPGARRG